MNAVRIILVIFVIVAVIGCQRKAGQTSEESVLELVEDDALSEGETGNQVMTGPGGT